MASFLDRLLGRPDAQKAVYGGPALVAYQNDIPLNSWMYGDRQSRIASYLRAYRLDWFYKAEKRISQDFAGLPIELRPGSVDDTDGVGDALQPADLLVPFDALNPTEQFLRLMERPNPNQTGRQLRQTAHIRWKLAGITMLYLENGEGGGLPTAIYGLSPARMTPSFDNAGNLIGWVMDKDRPSGGVPFGVDEILVWRQGSEDDTDPMSGVGVVEAITASVPLSGLINKHIGDVLQTGGRMAGMLWPKERALDEAQFQDAQRAWRSTVSDGNAARRLLLFPEPMEWEKGAATPAEIGIPELANLNRDEILTAFPIAPEMLRIPMPSGLNASGESRREIETAYWRDLHSDVESFEECIQSNLVARYEAATGQTLDFEMVEPDMDDAATLIEKVGAYKALIAIGIDPEEGLGAVGLDHIKWNGLPALLDPAQQLQMQQEAAQARTDALTASARGIADSQTTVNQPVDKARTAETREEVLDRLTPETRAALEQFFADQRERVATRIRSSYPQKAPASTQKAVRTFWATKSDPDWWDADVEDAALADAMRGIYVNVSHGGLGVVSNRLNRVVTSNITKRVISDLLTFGGQRIKDINDRTLQALTLQLAEGARRGYSISQIIDGVPADGYSGINGVTLENGTPVFGDLRAETIARTETATAYNRATLEGYAGFEVREVLAYDGDDDEECAARDGQTYDIDTAMSIEDHPNGTLDWAPVVDKAVHEEPKQVFTISPVTHIHMADTHLKADIPAPQVTAYIEPVINVPDQGVVVNVPEQSAPIVNVTNDVATPTVTVTNEVKTPSVTYKAEAPVVNVSVPEQPTPQVTVNVPKAEPKVTVKADMPEINVSVPTELRIVSMPDRVTKRRVERDQSGRIAETTDVETDG